jgi:hypothetical protein
LELEELRELLDDIGHDLGFVDKRFRHRLGLGCGLTGWGWLEPCNDGAKKTADLSRNPSHFVISLFDFNKGFLGLLVEFTSFLDGSDTSVGSKEDGDWINLQPQYFFDQLTGKARAEQHSADHDVEQVLNACHAAVAFHE